MEHHDLLEHIRRRFLSGEYNANSRKNYGVEKAANKARKLRMTCRKVPSTKNTFEENVLRKAESIRTSAAFKQCCTRLNSYEDENVEIITKPYNSMLSLHTSERVSQVEKNSWKKSIECSRSKQFSPGTCISRSCAFKSALASAEEPRITKVVVDGDRFLRNSKMNSHLLQSTRLYNKNRVDKKDKVMQPQIATVKSSDAFNCSTKNEAISQHIDLNINGCGHSSSCDEINVKINQSFSTLNNLEDDIDKAARFLQASFSNRLSISSQFEYGKMNEKEYITRKRSYNDHLLPKQDIKGLTSGKILGCRLKAHIAYGRNVIEMSQHLRDVRDAFTNQILLHKHEVCDGRNLLSNERCFDRQSSFYATVQQRMNKALHKSLSYNMYQSSQYHQDRSYDPLNLPISSFSKIDSMQNDVNDDDDDAKKIVRSTESEITPQTVVQQEKNSDMELIDKSLSTHSIWNDVGHSDEVNNSPTYSSQELLKREHYASNTVKALRQFYKDSMLYFVELRRVYHQRKVEDFWKVENEEERIKAACLLLKRKYIDSVRSAMPMKNLVDYHLHETARIQLLNLDLQKHLILLKDSAKNFNFEKFRHGSEKVLLLTKDFEKNNLANELERWERKLRTRSRFKIDEDPATNTDSTRSLFSNPLRVVRNIQEVKVRNPSYNRNLQQLREELKWKRREADFLKRTFDKRVMRNDQSEENSLRAQIDAHVHYITETEKDIARLIKLQNENDDNNERLAVVSTGSYESCPAPSSEFSSVEVIAERMDGRFLETDKNRTNFIADVHPTNKSCNSEWDLENRNVESTHFPELILEEKSGTIDVSDSELYGETGSFKQDISKEALLMSLVCQSDTCYSQEEEQEKLVVQPNNIIDENETVANRCDLPSSVIDEQFFTPLPSDNETDNEKSDNGVDDRISSQESSSSFHTTIFSPIPDEQIDSKVEQKSLLALSPKSRKIKLTINPLSISKSPTSARYAASMPRDHSSRSPRDNPRSPKTASNRCISHLSASLLESLLDDSLSTMLMLNCSQTLENETFVLHEGRDKLTANSTTLPTDSSWQSDQSYDLNKIPVPENLIPGLDLSGINNTEAETVAEENDFSSKLEEISSPVEIKNDLVKSLKLMPSQFRYYLGDEEWAVSEIHSINEQIWNLARLKQPLEILISDDSSGIRSQEVQMRQMVADRCCEIAKCCFKDVGRRRYMGLANINCFRPQNPLHLESILQKQFSKYYESNKFDTKEKKRWELLSRGRNSDIENIVLEELYAEQDSWEDVLENYEDEIKAELVAELWHEQLHESLSAAINSWPRINLLKLTYQIIQLIHSIELLLVLVD
ncbi:hypothetical protein ACH3XW_27510 [Acanthocheilonema viteae]